MTGFSFRNLRQRDIALIVLVLVLVAAGLWYLYMYRPTMDRISQLEDERMRLQTEVQRGEAAERNLPVLREEVAQLELERIAFLQELPRESDVAGVLQQVRSSAENSDVLLNQLSQGNVSEAIEDVRPLGFDFSTSGNYQATMSFLQSLEDLQRYTKIRQVSLSRGGNPESDDPTLDGSFSLTFYVYTGDDPGEVQ